MTAETPTDLAQRSIQRRRRRDIALVLPVASTFAFLSPVPKIFDTEFTLFGMPLIFVFIYGLWLFLIFLSFRISSRLVEHIED